MTGTEAQKIIDESPNLKGRVVLGDNCTTILSRRFVKDLPDQDLLTLLSLPVCLIVPESVRDLLIMRIRRLGVPYQINTSTKEITIKKIE